MTKTARWLLILALAPCVLAAPALAGDVNLLLGQAQSNEALLEDAGVEGQAAFGVALSLDFDWPVALAVDVLSTSDKNTISIPTNYTLQYTTDVSRLEADLGVRKYWREKLRPYIGGGVAWIRLEAKQTAYRDFGGGNEFTDVVVDDSSGDFGYWLNAGVVYTVGSHFNLGLDLRYSDADSAVRPNDVEDEIRLDPGAMQYALILGYRW
jgi:opacity protein-like surface antigen